MNKSHNQPLAGAYRKSCWGKKSAPRFFGLGRKKVPLALFSIWRPPESSDFAQNFTGAPENYLATSLKVWSNYLMFRLKMELIIDIFMKMSIFHSYFNPLTSKHVQSNCEVHTSIFYFYRFSLRWKRGEIDAMQVGFFLIWRDKVPILIRSERYENNFQNKKKLFEIFNYSDFFSAGLPAFLPARIKNCRQTFFLAGILMPANFFSCRHHA